MHSGANKPSGRLKRSLQENQAKAERLVARGNGVSSCFTLRRPPFVRRLPHRCTSVRFCTSYRRVLSRVTCEKIHPRNPNTRNDSRILRFSPSFRFHFTIVRARVSLRSLVLPATKIRRIDIHARSRHSSKCISLSMTFIAFSDARSSGMASRIFHSSSPRRCEGTARRSPGNSVPRGRTVK